MRKPLLVTALVAMQLLSWSGNALYLCLCDGSACLDFGPENCHCCPAAHQCAHEARPYHSGQPQPAHLVEFGEPADDSCNCPHVQISPVSGPMVVDDSSTAKVLGTATAPHAAPIGGLTERPCVKLSERGGAPPPTPQNSLTALSVMLRC
jgi:hypothetical protein